MVALAIVALPAYAGDDVDYSAPYLVVEDGELVTRYPAREHEATDARTAAPTDATVAVDNSSEPVKTWLIVAVVLAVLAAVVEYVRRRSQTGSASDGA